LRPSVAPASGAANTNRFFGHWRGLVVRTTAASQVGERGIVVTRTAACGPVFSPGARVLSTVTGRKPL